MRKSGITMSSFIVLLFFILISCERDVDEYKEAVLCKFSVDEAKSAFEDEVKLFEVKTLIPKPKSRGVDALAVTPLWSKGLLFSNESGDYVEVPLNIPLTRIYQAKDSCATVLEEEVPPNTVIRLLVQKTSETNYAYSIVHITGDSLYVARGKWTLARTSLSNLNKFSGNIRYFDLEKNFLWGEIYKGGEKIGCIMESGKREQNIQAQTRGHYVQHCYEEPVIYENCYYTGYEDSEGNLTITHVDCYYTTSWEAYCYNEYVSDGDGGSGGDNSGGGYPGGGSTVTPEEQALGISFLNATDPQRRRMILDLLKKLHKTKGCDFSGLNVYFGRCASIAGIAHDTLYICERFFDPSKNDTERSAAIWHECYHDIHDDKSAHKLPFMDLPKPITLTDIPPYIQTILDDMYESYGDAGLFKDIFFYQELTFNLIGPPGIYQNEINAYQAEMKEWPDVSPLYKDERIYMLWFNQERLKLSQQYYNK